MPNRILRDWTDSFKFDGITPASEVLFNRLIMKADDFGRYHAHPQLIKSGCFPLADDLRANTVAAWLTELSDRRLVFCYKSGDRELLAIVNFGQRLREDVNPKFPAPQGRPERWLATENEPTRRDPPRPAGNSGLGGDGGVFGDGGECGGGVGTHAPEVCTEDEAVGLTVNAGIPEEFVRYVHQDWSTRQGKDAGGVPVRFLPYATKRWTREQVEWKAKTHRGRKSGSKQPAEANQLQETIELKPL